MKKMELLKIIRESLKMMSNSGIMRDDYKYVKLVEEYLAMRANKVKHIVAIRILSTDYHISIRTVQRIIKRLSGDC